MTPSVFMVLAVLSGLGLAEYTNPAFDKAQIVGSLAFKNVRLHQKAVKNGNHQDAAKVQEVLFKMRSKIIQSKNNLASNPNPDSGSGKYSKAAQEAITKQLTDITDQIDTMFLNKIKSDSICPFFLENAKKTLNDNVEYENVEKEITEKSEVLRGVITLIEQKYNTRREDEELPPMNKTKLNELVCEKWKGDKLEEKNVIQFLLEEMNIKDVSTTSTPRVSAQLARKTSATLVTEKYVRTTSTAPSSADINEARKTSSTPSSADKWYLFVKKLKIRFPNFSEKLENTIKSLRAHFEEKNQYVPFYRLERLVTEKFNVPNTAFKIYKAEHDRQREEALKKVPPVMSDELLKLVVWRVWKKVGERILNKSVLKKAIEDIHRSMKNTN